MVSEKLGLADGRVPAIDIDGRLMGRLCETRGSPPSAVSRQLLAGLLGSAAAGGFQSEKPPRDGDATLCVRLPWLDAGGGEL